ncbi:hypothetical protein SAY60_002877 [Salmonella enterica]|nr:hypothetical protein [Salmonella enterica]
MKLKDFYFADRHAEGSRMPILLPNGEDSGEWLQVIGPDCDAAVQAGRAYTAAIRRLDEELLPLEKECEALGNYAKYNDQRSYRVEDLNNQLAQELVIGWSMDDEFSKEALAKLIKQYRGLSMAVAEHHTKSREALSVK